MDSKVWERRSCSWAAANVELSRGEEGDFFLMMFRGDTTLGGEVERTICGDWERVGRVLRGDSGSFDPGGDCVILS